MDLSDGPFSDQSLLLQVGHVSTLSCVPAFGLHASIGFVKGSFMGQPYVWGHLLIDN